MGRNKAGILFQNKDSSDVNANWCESTWDGKAKESEQSFGSKNKNLKLWLQHDYFLLAHVRMGFYLKLVCTLSPPQTSLTGTLWMLSDGKFLWIFYGEIRWVLIRLIVKQNLLVLSKKTPSFKKENRVWIISHPGLSCSHILTNINFDQGPAFYTIHRISSRKSFRIPFVWQTSRILRIF